MDYEYFWKYRCGLFVEWSHVGMDHPDYMQYTLELATEASRLGLNISGTMIRGERALSVNEAVALLSLPGMRQMAIDTWEKQEWVKHCPPCYTPDQANG
jgi:hypothetical protein